MANVLVTGFLHQAGRSLLDARAGVACEYLDEATVAEIDARIADADAVILGTTPFGADTIARAGRLKVVSRFGVGYDNVDVAALTARGIPLAIVGDANAVTVAEHTLSLMLAAARRLVVHDRETRAGSYGVRDPLAQSDLARKTVLVVGFGRVGRRVARRCAAFEMDVVVADPFVARETVEDEGHRHVADFRDALADADFVTLHLPGNAHGEPVLGTAEFAALKPGAYLVNAARGSLVDEDALVDALKSGRVRGAALDVLRREPPAPDNPLLALDAVTLAPHAASMTAECMARMSVVSAQNVLDALDGRLDPERVVNREVLRATPPHGERR
ncbi:MAG: NAD(P)-dependent oxidoreductase [Alphaproteobacteria bacterium]